MCARFNYEREAYYPLEASTMQKRAVFSASPSILGGERVPPSLGWVVEHAKTPKSEINITAIVHTRYYCRREAYYPPKQ